MSQEPEIVLQVGYWQGCSRAETLTAVLGWGSWQHACHCLPTPHLHHSDHRLCGPKQGPTTPTLASTQPPVAGGMKKDPLL
ncbi:hypothetical protein J4Q44_G00111250 [Coregonus suidteri]|uniref:Uncharacterized protein n=1 Tax=Coregonus suidteri TaxID=861788 RepID=A0AAN8LX60_9TELE